MMAHGGCVLCSPNPLPQGPKAASKLQVSSGLVSLSSGGFWELWMLGSADTLVTTPRLSQAEVP